MAKQYRKPHRYKKRKPFYRDRFFWLAIFVLILFSSSFYFLFLSDFFQIKNINISGFEEIPEERLSLLVGERLENKILFFSTKSIFLANSNEIKKDVLKGFPSVNQIQIKRNFPDALDVSVIEKIGLATFCQQFEEDKSSSFPFAGARESNCFVLDKEGIVFEENDGLQPVLIRTLISTDEISLGDKVIEKDDLDQISEINSFLEENLDIPIKEFIISSVEKLTALTQEGWELYFNPREDIKWQLTKLKVLLDEKIPPEKRKDLQWIELRFGNFANPKYKD